MNTTTKKAANSIVGKLTAGILAGAAVAARFAPAAGRRAPAARVLVVGDSLEVGSGPYLRRPLAGTSPSRSTRRRAARAAQGVRVLAAPARPAARCRGLPARHERQPVAPGRAGRRPRRRSRGWPGNRCMVVATIVRPPPGRRLRGRTEPRRRDVRAHDRRAAGRLARGRRERTRRCSGRDGVHATGDGYALRASLLAEAVQGCARWRRRRAGHPRAARPRRPAAARARARQPALLPPAAALDALVSALEPCRRRSRAPCTPRERRRPRPGPSRCWARR